MHYVFFFFSDRRMGYCFLQTIGGRCTARTSDLKTVTKADCCCTMGAAWGPHCEICPTKDSDNYNELCLDKGFSVNGQGTNVPFFIFNNNNNDDRFIVKISLSDIDECRTIPDLCKNGLCINTLGSYRCVCNKGYKADKSGTQCVGKYSLFSSIVRKIFDRMRYISNFDRYKRVRVNAKTVQVQLSEHGRKFHLFLSGRFHLEPRWRQLQRSGRVRDRESSVPTELHQHSRKLHLRLPRGLHARRRRLPRFVMRSNDQSYSFNSLLESCNSFPDINECDQPGTCPKPGTCINTLGSFRCICPRGFKLDQSGRFCIDQNECADDSTCEHGCQV